jgi:hypothetical protein
MVGFLDEAVVLRENDLKKREGIKEIIQRPIVSCFGIKRPTVVVTEEAQACLVAFNIVEREMGTWTISILF